jgi:hypothetical protein
MRTHITPRTHYLYTIIGSMPYGLNWLTKYSRFKRKLFPDIRSDGYEATIKNLRDLEALRVEAALWVRDEFKSNRALEDDPLMFFIPDGYTPKFGFVWFVNHLTIVVSPMEIPTLRDYHEVWDEAKDDFDIERPEPLTRFMPSLEDGK